MFNFILLFRGKTIFVFFFLTIFITLIFVYFLFHRQVLSLFAKPICINCNVILVSLDTLGANHLPCYGYYRNTSPNLCQFAKNNVFFTQSYSNAPWTLPSHFSIFTSLYPKHHGIENYTDKLSNNNLTLTEILKSQGYQTIFIGPTNDRSLPLDKGLGRGFDKIIRYKNIDSWKEGYRMLLDNAKNNKQTFLFLHTYYVHSPYLVGNLGTGTGNKRLFTSLDFPQIPASFDELNTFSPSFLDFLASNDEILNYLKKNNGNPYSTEDLEKAFDSLPDNIRSNIVIYQYYFTLMQKYDPSGQYARALYDELIVYLDKHLSELFHLVVDKRLANNTILIITSDHGEEFQEHGHFGHPVDELYNTITTTPLVMYIPSIKQRNITHLVQSIDIAPTILDMLGIKTQTHFDGIDLTNLILNRQPQQSNNYIISEGLGIDSIRNQQWKLYVNYDNAQTVRDTSLFDLREDKEEKNIANQYPSLVNNMTRALNFTIYKKHF